MRLDLLAHKTLINQMQPHFGSSHRNCPSLTLALPPQSPLHSRCALGEKRDSVSEVAQPIRPWEKRASPQSRTPGRERLFPVAWLRTTIWKLRLSSSQTIGHWTLMRIKFQTLIIAPHQLAQVHQLPQVQPRWRAGVARLTPVLRSRRQPSHQSGGRSFL